MLGGWGVHAHLPLHARLCHVHEWGHKSECIRATRVCKEHVHMPEQKGTGAPVCAQRLPPTPVPCTPSCLLEWYHLPSSV